MVTSLMMLDEGFNRNIRCRFINRWLRVDFIVSSKEKLKSEIERTHPDVVVMDLYLYAKIDGIETSRLIRSQFDVPVIYNGTPENSSFKINPSLFHEQDEPP